MGICKILWVFALLWIAANASKKDKRPHVVMVVLDDLGVKDLSYSTKLTRSLYKEASYAPAEDCCEATIPTPHIDELAGRGVQLARHYVHPTCTPTRAALMTGRYSANTGLPLAMLHGSVAGLPHNMDTLPSLLKSEGYRTHMAGKWHLGHSQWAQTPVGKGFESHTGSFLWDLDSWNKEIHSFLPWRATCIDWTTSYENYSYTSFGEPRHATEAITEAAKDRIFDHVKEHKQRDNSFTSPLFLYVAYTAAHSPLQPMDRHVEKCSHIPHDWRRDFCGMVVGLDEAIHNLTTTIEEQLGENVLLMLTSDNGGSTWFGGLNSPFRSGKTTPLEGGVRVPAFFVDFTKNHRYFGKPRVLGEMVHAADWTPTLLDIAGVSSKKTKDMDGFSLFKNLKQSSTTSWPRESAILDMHYGTEGESAFLDSDIASLVKGKYKLIVGDLRDPNHYFEPTGNSLRTTDESYITPYYENLIRFGENLFGKGPFDSVRVVLTHIFCHGRLEERGVFMLFDVEADPEEKNDLAEDPKYKSIIDELHTEMMAFKKQRPPQRKYWQAPPVEDWKETFVEGDCSAYSEGDIEGSCRFTVPWLDDEVDTVALENDYPTRITSGQQLIELTRDMRNFPGSYWWLWLWLCVCVYWAWGVMLFLLSLCLSP